jgi:hypothetical protein
MAIEKENQPKVPRKAPRSVPAPGPGVDLKKVAERARELSRLLGKK